MCSPEDIVASTVRSDPGTALSKGRRPALSMRSSDPLDIVSIRFSKPAVESGSRSGFRRGRSNRGVSGAALGCGCRLLRLQRHASTPPRASAEGAESGTQESVSWPESTDDS